MQVEIIADAYRKYGDGGELQIHLDDKKINPDEAYKLTESMRKKGADLFSLMKINPPRMALT
jgi:hypothetical protein